MFAYSLNATKPAEINVSAVSRILTAVSRLHFCYWS